MKKMIGRLKKGIRLAKIIFHILSTQHSRRFILIGSPLHGNIGDHAISIAERVFISEYFNNVPVVEIAGADFKYLKRYLSGAVNTKDYILITGGGFMGNLWLNEEEMIRQVILSFPDNPVFILPQTIYYSSDKNGQTELYKSERIYGKHKNLNIFLREKQSYEFVRNHFPRLRLVECVPDMVLYLNLAGCRTERKGILICFREDKEKIMDETQLVDCLREKYGKIVPTTTVLNRGIMFGEREKIFYEKIKEFQCSRLVVTDRLHGMLFAAVTGTPCIALDNLSGKVRGVYEWISDLDYVKFARSTDEVLDYADMLLQMEDCRYDNERLKYYFSRIAERMGSNECK